MAYDLTHRLVIGIASSALFDLGESDRIFREEGEEAYRRHQFQHQGKPLEPGVAFPFVKRVLSINAVDAADPAVEVVLLSRNDPDTGLRVMNSIEHHRLDITRAAFLKGRIPYHYIRAFNVSLFLTANEQDVKDAVAQGYPAGQVLGNSIADTQDDGELRIAFDFDGVLADDEAESVYANSGNDLDLFQVAERSKADTPHNPGPLKDLLVKISRLQKRERDKKAADPSFKPRIRTAIITARSAPAHARVVTTLRDWGVSVDETFFLGGVRKKEILQVLKPHIFFDDQRLHLDPTKDVIPSVHIPFGVRNP